MNKNYHLISVPNVNGPIVMNVRHNPSTFGTMRNGDMVAICNVVEHLRQRENRRDIKFWIEDATINNQPYCFKFRDFLIENTDYISREPGQHDINKHNVPLWSGYRVNSGDCVKIPNPRPKKQKICVFPVFDAQYNTFRNWPISTAQKVINDANKERRFDNYEKIFCSMHVPNQINYDKFTIRY